MVHAEQSRVQCAAQHINMLMDLSGSDEVISSCPLTCQHSSGLLHTVEGSILHFLVEGATGVDHNIYIISSRQSVQRGKCNADICIVNMTQVLRQTLAEDLSETCTRTAHHRTCNNAGNDELLTTGVLYNKFTLASAGLDR